jgi:hypothetical protein
MEASILRVKLGFYVSTSNTTELPLLGLIEKHAK